ncbi:MAG: MjaI family restriction endonuclease [Lachnospiraceae bacterium]|nr:MjaI family restriction endonuclease [Lachnospiraceae bacterium]
MIYRIRNEEIAASNGTEKYEFPKYAYQLISWANRNAQGTRPGVIGPVMDLFSAFLESGMPVSPANWRRFYTERYPGALEAAGEKICAQLQNLRRVMPGIDPPMVRRWLEDMVFVRPFNRNCVRDAVFLKISEATGAPYRAASAEDALFGVDGYLGGEPFRLVPVMDEITGNAPRRAGVRHIAYTRTKSGVNAVVEEPDAGGIEMNTREARGRAFAGAGRGEPDAGEAWPGELDDDAAWPGEADDDEVWHGEEEDTTRAEAGRAPGIWTDEALRAEEADTRQAEAEEIPRAEADEALRVDEADTWQAETRDAGGRPEM